MLLVSACVTPAPAERVAGCWISRAGDSATTMRWFPDPQRPGAMSGAMLRYGAGDPVATNFTLRPRGEGAELCRLGEAGACWPLAAGEEGGAEGHAFIDSLGDRLRISVVDARGETILFDGAQDGCD